MEEESQDGIELEIREHTDADYFPEECPFCGGQDIRRHTYKMREIQDLGSPMICRRIYYERVYFICKRCKKIFNIEHPLIPGGFRYMPSVIEYALSRILDEGDLIRRVTRDLNKLHLVKVSLATVEKWVNQYGKKGKIDMDFSEEKPPKGFSGYISIDGTFKSVTTKKNDQKMD